MELMWQKVKKYDNLPCTIVTNVMYLLLMQIKCKYKFFNTSYTNYLWQYIFYHGSSVHLIWLMKNSVIIIISHSYKCTFTHSNNGVLIYNRAIRSQYFRICWYKILIFDYGWEKKVKLHLHLHFKYTLSILKDI